jgi:hypothetical protein
MMGIDDVVADLEVDMRQRYVGLEVFFDQVLIDGC